MGANAQTAVPAFVAGEVLTAAEMTQVNTGIPVFATTTTRDAAFGGTGEKTLAEGQFAYIEATDTTQYYNGSAWVAVGASGLTLVKSQVIGSAVASVTVTDAFSTTYDAYKIVISGGAASTGGTLNMTLGATATGYNGFQIYSFYTGSTVSGFGFTNSSSQPIGQYTTNIISVNADVINPFLSKYTTFTSFNNVGAFYMINGELANTTSYTAFTLTCSTGTLTGGTIRIYGYANS